MMQFFLSIVRIVLLGAALGAISCQWGNQLQNTQTRLSEIQNRLNRIDTPYELLSKQSTEQEQQLNKLTQQISKQSTEQEEQQNKLNRQLGDLAKKVESLEKNAEAIRNKLFCEPSDVEVARALDLSCLQSAQGCSTEDGLRKLKMLRDRKLGFPHVLLRFRHDVDLNSVDTQLEERLPKKKIELLQSAFEQHQAPNFRVLLIGVPRNTPDIAPKVLRRKLAELKQLMRQHFGTALEMALFFELEPNRPADPPTQDLIDEIYRSYTKIFADDRRILPGEPRDSERQIVVWLFGIWC